MRVVLVDPAWVDHPQGDILVERVVIDYWLFSDALEDPGNITFFGHYIHVFETDVSEALPADISWDPMTVDPDGFEKKPMVWRRELAPDVGIGYGTGTMWNQLSPGQPLDINVKRKLTGDQALVWVLGSRDTATPEVEPQVIFQARVLLSLGRR